MIDQPLNALQSDYLFTRQNRYWSAQSQPYAAGDQMLRYLLEGWEIDPRVEVESHWFGDARHIVIYHVVLKAGDKRLPMRVLGTPYVQNMLSDKNANFDLVPVRATRRRVRFAPISTTPSEGRGIRA